MVSTYSTSEEKRDCWKVVYWDIRIQKGESLCLGHLIKRFLSDENGEVDAIEMRCNQPKVGLSKIIFLMLGFSKFMILSIVPLEVLSLREKSGITKL
jgi:hypothetical protein